MDGPDELPIAASAMPPMPWTPGQAFDPVASLQDIYHCFRLLLGRDPSVVEWTGHGGFAGNDLRDVVRSYLNSREFAERRMLDADEPRDIGLTRAAGFLIYTDPHDLAVGKHVAAGAYEPGLTAIFRETLRPGMHVVDLGANIGFFTMLAASIVAADGSVLAIEPNLANVRLIEASRRANGFAHVTIAACGAGKSPGILALNTAFSNGMTGPVGNALADIMAARIVPCMPLSSLLSADRKIDFIKIDVEGAEYLALASARDLLARWRPVIASEFSPELLLGNSGVSGRQYLEFLAGIGYRIGIIDIDGNAPDATIPQVLQHYESSGVDHIDILLRPATAVPGKRSWRKFLAG